MANINLTKNDSSLKVNLVKGANQDTINSLYTQTKKLRDETSVFKDIASTKATEASNSANNALASANSANSSSNSSMNYANNASQYATQASSSASSASISATNSALSEANALAYKNSTQTLKDTVVYKESLVGQHYSEIDAVANNIANVNTVANNIANVNTVATISGDITAVSSITANITTVSTMGSDINTIVYNAPSINTVSGNISAINTINNNMVEILQADTNAEIATTKASEALASANNALTNANNALASANSAETNKNNTFTYMNTASGYATTASTKASEASTSASQALTYKNAIQSYVIPSGTSYSLDQSNTFNGAMTKAQFNALTEERKANRAGSGFDSFGWGSTSVPSTDYIINEGVWVRSSNPNVIVLSRSDTASIGVSKSKIPVVNVSGVQHKIFDNGGDRIVLPTAPNIYPHDTVLTAEQIASGVIKHADASNSGLVLNGKGLSGTTFSQTVIVVNGKKYIIEYKDNGVRKTLEVTASSTSYSISLTGTDITEVGMYPADAISRSDLVFLESWHEDISEKNFVYPLGNVQYLGSNTDGLTGIANGAFTGFETYSLFGNWQSSSALIGKGYVWSTLTEVQKKAFISNPDNNCYLDGDKVIQVRYRVRVVQGLGDSYISGGLLYYNDISGRVYTNNDWLKPKGKLVNITNDLAAYSINETGYYSKININFLKSSDYASDYGLLVAIAKADSAFETQTSYNGRNFAILLCSTHRRNQGMYHPVYNANGTKKASDSNFWYNTAVSFTSISDCFDPAKLLTASGYIGTVSGRPDVLFYDQIHESDILDLRNSSKKVEDYNRLISREFNKLVAGTTRGKEGEWEILAKSDVTLTYGNYISGNNINNYLLTPQNLLPTLPLNISLSGIFILLVKSGMYAGKVIKAERIFVDSNYFQIGSSPYPVRFTDGSVVPTLTGSTVDIFFARQTTRTKSNTLLHCDIIGNPTNYPTSWKQNGVFGTPLIVAEDRTSLLPDGVLDSFKLSKKANATPLLCLRSTDNGATWTSFTPTFSTTTNAITLTDEPANNLVMVYYQTKTSMAVPVVNSEVLEIGDVFATSYSSRSPLVSSLIEKVPTYPAGIVGVVPTQILGKPTNYIFNYLSNIEKTDGYRDIPQHKSTTLTPVTTPSIKVFPYLTRLNGKAYLNLVFKEMKHNGTSWGDDAKFNIVDNVSTTTDNNAQTVLIGQKTVELPYFIGADE